jgi:hypothetical protein
MALDRESYSAAVRTAGTGLLHELDALLTTPHDVFGVAAPFRVAPEQAAEIREHLAAIRTVVVDVKLTPVTTGHTQKENTPKAKAPRKRSKYLY